MTRAPRSLATALHAAAVAAVVLGLETGAARAQSAADVRAGRPGPAAATATPLSYNRDVQPILSQYCFACHGPDDAARQADLRLDLPSANDLLGSGRRLVSPFRSSESELIRRVSHPDPDRAMPPAEVQRRPRASDIAILRRWIDEGAEWEPHWAFQAPQRPEVPAVPAGADPGWSSNPIDAFILERLGRENLQPSPRAERNTLARRVSLDLTGLPPTLDEVDAFVQRRDAAAYAQLVDRLLSSPRHAERLTMDWLDAARYADTNGYHIDNERSMWRWRDVVLDSFARNLPFDSFTVSQLAGDLLPAATLEQRIASGFNRNHMVNFEGGAIDEEYRTEYVLDRTTTTATVWMGLTLGCARCHDHKFDPLSQRDFYRFAAFFNNVDEQGLDGEQGNAAPFIEAPNPSQQEEWGALRERIDQLARRLDGPIPETDGDQALWERQAGDQLLERWAPVQVLSASSREGARLTQEPDGSLLADGPDPVTDQYEIIARTDATAICDLRVEVLTHPSLPRSGPGRSESANFVLSHVTLEMAPASQPDAWRSVPLMTAFADYSQPGYDVKGTLDPDVESGWAVSGHDHAGQDRVALFVPRQPFGEPGGSLLRVRLSFDSRHAHHTFGRFRLAVGQGAGEFERLRPSTRTPWFVAGPFSAAAGESVHERRFAPEDLVDLGALDLDARPLWSARPELVDGKAHDLTGEWSATYFYRLLDAPSARHTLLGLGSDDGVRVWVNDQLVHDHDVVRGVSANEDRVEVELHRGNNRLLMKISNRTGQSGFAFDLLEDGGPSLPLGLAMTLLRQAQVRAGQWVQTWKGPDHDALRRHYRRHHSVEWRALDDQRERLVREEAAMREAIPDAMVMQERAERRPTYVLERGQYDRPGKAVTRGVPGVLGSLPQGSSADRLALARWLVDRSHPLTARVVVNRLWAMLFGTGLVATLDDFGTSGGWPSHPELLDWLAVEFMESGWNVRHMLRLMVNSSTYQQSSRVRPDLLERDPGNRLLARGPRGRLPAEMVRDGALAISGLLVERLGGPSVRPYEPEGAWEDVAYQPEGTSYSGQVFVRGTGEDLYRRSLYTFWKRSSPPSSLSLFDAPNREVCSVRRSVTNTPLQALALLNDVTYVEAARALAQRMLREAGPDSAARIDHGWRLATSRLPRPDERAVLQELLDSRLAAYRADPTAAVQLIAVGELPADPGLDPPELAAWTTVASVLLNLDETITKH